MLFRSPESPHSRHYFRRRGNSSSCRLLCWLPDNAYDALRSLSFKIAALALSDDSVPVDDPWLLAEPRLALVLGTEGDGLSKRAIDGADYVVRIPMYRGVDSLNVAAASAVAFYITAKGL